MKHVTHFNTLMKIYSLSKLLTHCVLPCHNITQKPSNQFWWNFACGLNKCIGELVYVKFQKIPSTKKHFSLIMTIFLTILLISKITSLISLMRLPELQVQSCLSFYHAKILFINMIQVHFQSNPRGVNLYA